MVKIRESWHDDPSEDEIARVTAEIRARWTDRETRSRSNCMTERVTVTTVVIERQNPRPAHW
jgi:hypothetical protein